MIDRVSRFSLTFWLKFRLTSSLKNGVVLLIGMAWLSAGTACQTAGIGANVPPATDWNFDTLQLDSAEAPVAVVRAAPVQSPAGYTQEIARWDLPWKYRGPVGEEPVGGEEAMADGGDGDDAGGGE